MENYKVSVSDGYCTHDYMFISKSADYSIEDIIAIIGANTDLKRVSPKSKSGDSQNVNQPAKAKTTHEYYGACNKCKWLQELSNAHCGSCIHGKHDNWEPE